MKEAKQLERKVEDINKPTELGLRIPDSKLQGLSLQEPRKFVSRAKHASWGPLPYSVNIEELLELPFVEVIIVSCILLSAFLAAVDTLPVLQEPNCSEVLFALNWVENSICICFFVEFWLRWYSRSFRPSYILKPLVIIDILAFLPVFIESVSGPPSFVAGFRLLRVFRLQRFLKDYNAFLTLATGLGIDRNYVTPVYLEVTRVLLTIFTLLYTATGAIYAAEHDVNPQFPDFFTALYFGLTTLTTVGFGDITPITTSGRLVVAASILAGGAVIPFQLSRLAEVFMKNVRGEMETEVETHMETEVHQARHVVEGYAPSAKQLLIGKTQPSAGVVDQCCQCAAVSDLQVPVPEAHPADEPSIPCRSPLGLARLESPFARAERAPGWRSRYARTARRFDRGVPEWDISIEASASTSLSADTGNSSGAYGSESSGSTWRRGLPFQRRPSSQSSREL
ncbi:Potassium voltage-gated channel subfamily B member 2 [Durusdinium trenchii]|uniref:Potassium voltage-gated channel subfamily B member 2 n=1 Tax=Durusdinium trenchii TaxID=1381693 RepID=A0ABP0LXI2_9DINO